MKIDFEKIYKRAVGIIVKPNSEWELIKHEEDEVEEVFNNYALPFIVVIALSEIIGGIYGGGAFSVTLTKSIIGAIFQAATIYASAYLLSELARSYGSSSGFSLCFKVVVFASTSSWLISILINLSDSLSFLILFTVYSLYLFWQGLFICIEISGDKKISYIILSMISILILEGVLGYAASKLQIMLT